LEGFGSKARGSVQRYSWDNITNEFERILEEAIKGETWVRHEYSSKFIEAAAARIITLYKQRRGCRHEH
jgi:hypothetical protein